ncbi:MAG: RNaseH domain-containing protein, partial [Bacteroidota bacterium]
ECDRLWIVRIREHIRGETPTAIAKGKPGSRVSTGGIFKWNGACDSAEHTIFLSFRDLLNSEQRVLNADQSRLDKGNAPAANPKPLEIALIHNPGIEDEQLAILVHVLRSRWPYFSNDVALPFPFPFAIKAKEYAINARDNPQDSDEHREA